MAERRIVFYSWQSDLPNSTNRGFIENALKAAAKTIAADDTIGIEPVIDRDTAGIPGSPDIASTIFAKIDGADVVVLDVSIITDPPSGRPCPNPNVLVELGYAVKSKSWDNVLLVMNTAYGPPTSLPFDLRMHRTMTYELPEGGDDGTRAEQKKRLESQVKAALRAILEQHRRSEAGVVIEPESLATTAIKAIRASAPDRRSAIRRFGAFVVGELAASDPKLGAQTDTFKQLENALSETVDVIADFARVASNAAEFGDRETVLELHRVLEPIAARYELSPTHSGPSFRHQFDYWRFVGHEQFLELIAALVREERWNLLRDVFNEDLYVPNRPDHQGPGNVSFDHHDRPVMLAAAEAQRENLFSKRAYMLKARHDAEPLKDVASFADLCAADLFVFLRSELPIEPPHEYPDWFADVFLLCDQPPTFLYRAARTDYAGELASALGLANGQQLRERLLERRGLLKKGLRTSVVLYMTQPLPDDLVNKIATKP